MKSLQMTGGQGYNVEFRGTLAIIPAVTGLGNFFQLGRNFLRSWIVTEDVCPSPLMKAEATFVSK